MSHFTVMFGELYSAGKEFKPRIPTRQRLKQLAFRSSPLLVAAAAGTGALCVQKMRQPPAADFIASSASFQCGPVQRLLARHEVTAAGGDVESLCRAARRMRGPIERDLAAAECLLAGAADGGEQVPTSSLEQSARALQLELSSMQGRSAKDLRKLLWARLMEVWKAAGYFSEPKEYQRPSASNWAGLNPATGENESYGRDVGCEVPLCMLHSTDKGQADLNRLSPAQLAPAANALEQHGVVRLSGLVSDFRLAQLRQRLQMHTSALDARLHRREGGREVGPIREYDTKPLEEEDPELQFVTSLRGRTHFLLRGQLLEDVVHDVQAGALPLIWESLVSTSHGSSSKRSPYISEMQLVVMEPGAGGQFWHIDNSAKGLTLVVPLTPLPDDMGPNSFMLGSHHLFNSNLSYLQRLKSCASSLLMSDGLAAATMKSGDGLVYDSRTIHRGETNLRYDRTGVSLIFRYDFERPPGYGAFGTIATSWAGSALASLIGFYARLPSR